MKTIVETKTIKLFPQGFSCENGTTLAHIDVAYETYGILNSDGTNAILICHALTGSAHAAFYNREDEKSPGWWDGAIGEKKAFDPKKNFILCSNILGGCYGTTGPNSKNPTTNKPYGEDFPSVTIRDMVRIEHELAIALGIKKFEAVAGGSMGGMQALEWALMYPEMVDEIIVFAAAAAHSSWGIAWGYVEREAIRTARTREEGLKVARAIAMISYRAPESFALRHGRAKEQDLYNVESYLRYQGEKLFERFNVDTYLRITEAMDTHDVARDRGTIAEVLAGIKAKALVVGISSDILYPAREQEAIATMIPNARYEKIISPHGHDAFLIEYDQLNSFVKEFRR